jgi:hypothetical protein
MISFINSSPGYLALLVFIFIGGFLSLLAFWMCKRAFPDRRVEFSSSDVSESVSSDSYEPLHVIISKLATKLKVGPEQIDQEILLDELASLVKDNFVLSKQNIGPNSEEYITYKKIRTD